MTHLATFTKLPGPKRINPLQPRYTSCGLSVNTPGWRVKSCLFPTLFFKSLNKWPLASCVVSTVWCHFEESGSYDEVVSFSLSLYIYIYIYTYIYIYIFTYTLYIYIYRSPIWSVAQKNDSIEKLAGYSWQFLDPRSTPSTPRSFRASQGHLE